MDFTNKVVLITGAGAGIGRVSAIMFAQHHAKVAINDIRESGDSDTLAQVQSFSEGLYVKGNVSSDADARRIVEKTVEQFGRIDILVNNAGIVLPGTIDNTAEEAWTRTLQVNLTGVFLMSKYAILQMKKQGGGAIVNISSSVALKGVKDRAAYTASKGGVLSLTREMAADYMDDHIRVNCICPGTTFTPSLQERLNVFQDVQKATDDFIARQPMKRFGKDSEIATAILFACCNEAAFMNGSILSIDGGMTCC